MTTSLTPPIVEPQEATQPAPPQTPARTRTEAHRDAWTAAAFLTPGLIAFTLFVLVPTAGGFVLSFFDWDLFGPPVFVGLDNFTRLIVDPTMWKSLYISAMFVVLGVVPATIIGFLLAIVVNSSMRGVGALRVLYLTPMIASSAVTALIWSNVFQSRSGLLNQALAWVGIDGPNWLNDPFWAQPALVVIMIWSGLPLVILIYIAGLQRVPEDIYAAASLDGAGRFGQIWSMTWPNVTGTTAVVLVLQFIGFLSGSFELALIMTDGGPLGSTTSLALYAYKMAFTQNDIGYASALSFFQLALILILFFAGRGVRALWRKRTS